MLNEKDVNIYTLEGFKPTVVDVEYLHELGVAVEPAPETLTQLAAGSRDFMRRFEERTVIPTSRLEYAEIDLDDDLLIHNYTGKCPTLTFEVNPVFGCCIGCLYCLVTDGVHENVITVYTNYHLLLRRALEKNYAQEHYFYYSPKTDAFQQPTLETGMAHKILKEFIRHYELHPDSKIRLFIATKGGVDELNTEFEGETIIDLFCQLKDRMQFNTSLSMMPEAYRMIIEPYAASFESRLAAVRLCQERGVMANSALLQPILIPYLTDENVDNLFKSLAESGIINFKPEFLTACPQNLAMMGQILGYFDKDMERDLYECYLQPENRDHKKQRDRTAPTREMCKEQVARLMEAARRYGLSTSICYWVRQQLGISEDIIPLINSNGFQCLGYQSHLFSK